MTIVFNASLPINKPRKIKPKTKKKVNKSKIKISEEEKKGSNKLFDRLKRFVVFHTKLLYSAIFTLAVVLTVGYFGFPQF